MEEKIPLTWESVFQNQSLSPVILKTIEKIHDGSWEQTQESTHSHYELIYIKRGEAELHVADSDTDLTQNEVIIIKPEQPHKIRVISEDNCEFLVLYFKFSGTDSREKELSIGDFIKFVNDSNQPYVKLKLRRKNEVLAVLNRILVEQSQKEEWSEYLNYLLLMELFIHLSRAMKHDWEQNAKSRSVKLKELLEISREYIENNYRDDISLSDVSNYIFLSESYFAHAFKDEFGISPKHYLLSVRISSAKNLLSNTDQKINDIAKEIGFSSQQRFNDIFKKHEGKTPLKYRKEAKKKLINMR